ncbi:MAG TPA: hypothetical protein VGQ82_01485 [Chthoniobacterales bacterium]|nr:hypothetical protein [Chthoniobacterales bacterium]
MEDEGSAEFRSISAEFYSGGVIRFHLPLEAAAREAAEAITTASPTAFS